MEDFKGYIFMIIAILSAIVSIYQKSKKKGRQSKTLSSPRPKPLEPWKDIFDTDDANNTPQTFSYRVSPYPICTTVWLCRRVFTRTKQILPIPTTAGISTYRSIHRPIGSEHSYIRRYSTVSIDFCLISQ